jgi:hypothetical protein
MPIGAEAYLMRECEERSLSLALDNSPFEGKPSHPRCQCLPTLCHPRIPPSAEDEDTQSDGIQSQRVESWHCHLQNGRGRRTLPRVGIDPDPSCGVMSKPMACPKAKNVGDAR